MKNLENMTNIFNLTYIYLKWHIKNIEQIFFQGSDETFTQNY